MSKIDELLKDEKVEWKKLGEVCREKFWIMPTTPKFSDDFKIPYITGKNIKDGEIDFDKVKYISEEDYLSFIKNHFLNNEKLTISDFKGEFNVSRNNAVLILEFFDSKKITKRFDNYRIKLYNG